MDHLVRSSLVIPAYGLTWQAMQAPGWSEEQLSLLQREWERPDFFSALPESVAFSLALAAAALQSARTNPPVVAAPPSTPWEDPRVAFDSWMARLRQSRYRRTGTYEDEKAVLLYYREREVHIRNAIGAHTWLEMRSFPGVTNELSFRSTQPPRVRGMVGGPMGPGMGFLGQRQGLLSRTADAEARRRVVVAALALERFRLRHGSYPQALLSLVPELVKTTPIDFMDGQPLRYRVTNDGHFILYSVGLDCIDNGGDMRRPPPRAPRPMAPRAGSASV